MAETGHGFVDTQPWRPQGHTVPRAGRAWHAATCVGLVLAIAITALAVASEASHPPPMVYRVVSGSMVPTLNVGQVVHVDTSAYQSVAPRIGDVVAFHAPAGAIGDTPVCGVAYAVNEVCPHSTPAASDQIFIKRVVAGPGDTIALVSGSVVRNGVLRVEPWAAVCDGRPACNFPIAIKIPAGEWFLMGDDRLLSDDSRFWGPVPRAWFVGKVTEWRALGRRSLRLADRGL